MSKSSAVKTKKVGNDFLCPTVYGNILPPLPFEPKLLGGFEAQRRAELSALDHHPFPLDVVGSTLDAMPTGALRLGLVWGNTAFYYELPRPSKTALDPRDAALLAPYQPPPPKSSSATNSNAAAAAKPHRPIASWLRRTEYISNDNKLAKQSSQSNNLSQNQQQQQQQTPQKKSLQQQLPNSKEALVKAIEKTFVQAASANLTKLKHPTNPSLTATELLPLFPAFVHWPSDFYSVVFDADPISSSSSSSKEDALLAEDVRERLVREEAFLKYCTVKGGDGGNAEEEEEEVASLYIPSTQTTDYLVNKRFQEEDEDDDEDVDTVSPDEASRALEYKLVRDFTYKEKKESERNWMFFNISDEVATFHQLAGRVDLVRKRVKAKTFANRYDDTPVPSRPTVYQTTKRSRTRREVYEKTVAMHRILPVEYVEPEGGVPSEDELEELQVLGKHGRDENGLEEDEQDEEDGRERKRQQVVDEDGDAEW
ncbi:hypothetical protein BCR33DRAFT_784696 [Rhizoclosmatium globosum]|uniref:RNA polymerase II-associated n=1 Tax=Rhizoclosmatium globosum TaxID=329046 RepID=A0A1Y2CEF2_9FUNG|nr:hypothetical protein BCR33DRAFT_784696 [Rhizoclosmatium globosum]|eukprot:ORY45306.1 hypothetical protein BCR33DRAFT_784696 [Rhizoclosmatium globosum]